MSMSCEKGFRAEPWKITKVKLETEAGLLSRRLFAEFKRKTSALKNIRSQSKNQGADRVGEDGNSATRRIYFSE